MIRKLFACLALLTFFVAPAFAGPKENLERAFGAAGKPLGPAETFTAKDLPLNKQGAADDVAALLAQFDLEPQAFEYSLQPLADEEGFTMYRLTYPSPVETPWPENNVVPAEYYVPKGAAKGKPVPAAVVLDILDGSAIVPRLMARAAAQRGVASIYIPMPCFNARRPPGDAHMTWVADDPRRFADGLRQTVMDVRRARAILMTRPEVDPQQIGITGVSAGGIMTALAAGVDGEFTRVVPILSGGDMAGQIFSGARETRMIRRWMTDAGFSESDARAFLKVVDPLSYASRVPKERVLMINAKDDEVIPRATTDMLHAALGHPEIIWVKAGHYTAGLFLPLIQQRAIDFLKGPASQIVEEEAAAEAPTAE